MKLRYLKGVFLLLVVSLCCACASGSLSTPRCDLATAVPINVREVSRGTKASAAAPPLDATESPAPPDETSKDEGREP